jgi:hypothetical protein
VSKLILFILIDVHSNIFAGNGNTCTAFTSLNPIIELVVTKESYEFNIKVRISS